MELIIKRIASDKGNFAEIRKEKISNLYHVLCYDEYMTVFKNSYHSSLKSACAAIKRIEKQTGEKWRVEK